MKLPLLINDTDDIIEYRNDVQVLRDKIKKRIYEGLLEIEKVSRDLV